MQNFATLLAKHIVQFDGGFGTMIAQSSHSEPCMEMLNITHPDAVQAVHSAYVAAGAQVVETHSLGTNAPQLKRHGLENRVADLAAAAVKNAKAAAQGKALVAFSVSTLGRFLAPVGETTLDEAIEYFREPMRAAAEAGADLYIIETMTDIAEMRAAILAAQPLLLPIVASYTFQANGRTLTGGTPACAAIAAEALGVTALGINCSTGPEGMREPLADMRAASRLPIIIQPNAGLPCTDADGHTHYAVDADTLATAMVGLVEGGAAGIGGCCGTTPAHIEKMRPLTEALPPLPVCDSAPMVSSGRFVLPLAEAIEKAQPCALDNSDISPLYDLDEPEAVLLDLTKLSPADIDEAIPEAQTACAVPMILRVKDAACLDAALRAYVGRAAVANVPDGGRKAMESYGALEA